MAQQHPTAVPEGLALDSDEPRAATAAPARNGAEAPPAAAVTRPYDGAEPPELDAEPLLRRVRQRNPRADQAAVRRAFELARERHAGRRRASGMLFLAHPLGVAGVVADLGLDATSVSAALLHDAVDKGLLTLEEVTEGFGPEVARITDGLVKLDRIGFEAGREAAQAETVRKMVIAMARDIRVLVIKLADRLHNMRDIGYLDRDEQERKAREVLEVYAPLANRLGIHQVKWELEDLAFATLYPLRYEEIARMTAERQPAREQFVAEVTKQVNAQLKQVKLRATVTGRPKHYYSIYEKMVVRGKEFTDIFDLVGVRVLVDSIKDCYAALGQVHAVWKPVPGRFKDFIAMPKFNRYRSLHTTVIGPEGTPLEIQVRTREMHEEAEYGIAAHWVYKKGKGKTDDEWLAWVKTLMDWQQDEADPREFMKTFRTDLFDDEVYVFTPKGEVKTLPAGATPIDFAYAVHTDVGHKTVGAKINGRIVPLHYRLKNGDFVEILTSKSGRGPSRDWMSLAASSRARNKIRQWFQRETRGETEAKGREILDQALKAQNLPYRKLQGSAVLAQVIRETGFKKAEDFYIALGAGKLQSGQIVNKVLQRLKTDEVAEEPVVPLKAPRARSTVAGESMGIRVHGVDDVLVRMAKCCTPVPGDSILGYISLGRGITIHREDCPNAKALMKNPERFTPVEWEGGTTTSFRVQIAVDSFDRPRLLEDVARTFAEHGANIVSYGGVVEDGMARNWYTAEVGEVKELRTLLGALRNLDAVFDAYRVTPT